jgi:hypothetical protein
MAIVSGGQSVPVLWHTSEAAATLLAFGLSRVAQLILSGLGGDFRLAAGLGIGRLIRLFCILVTRFGFVPRRLVRVHVCKRSNAQTLPAVFCFRNADPFAFAM